MVISLVIAQVSTGLNRSRPLTRPFGIMSDVSEKDKEIADLIFDLNFCFPRGENAIKAWLQDHGDLLKLAGPEWEESHRNDTTFLELNGRAQEYAQKLGFSTADEAATATQTESSMTTNGTESTN